MWTPKRIVMLVVGFALFFTTYVAYAHFMGGIDGLPPLPEVDWPYPGKLDISKLKQPVNEATRKLCQAFGEDCDEAKNRSIKVVLNERGLVLATNECNPQDDGRVKLEPFSMAIFSKPKGNARYPEINTIRCNTALVTFDRPVKNQLEMGSRKIVAAELQGTITITNNRGTPQKTDDIEITIMEKPLLYTEKDHHVWSEGTVRLLDTQNVPYPTRITASGIDLYLTTAAAANAAEGGADRKAQSQKSRGDAINGVDRIILRQNVHMNLYVDAKNGFPGAAPGGLTSASESRQRPSEKLPPKPRLRDPRALAKSPGQAIDSDRAYLVIDTNGPFVYDLKKDLATFDIPPEAQGKGNLDNNVLVCREHNTGQSQGPLFDQLLCKHLELQFRRKRKTESAAGPGSRPADQGTTARSPDREIESAHAVGEVRLALDTQSLEAHGDDLVYIAPLQEKGQEKGPETTLTGIEAPLEAVKDCNVIHAKKLWLWGASPDGKIPAHATAQGPGRIDLADHPSNNARLPVHVLWKDKLIFNKDGIYDHLTLTGGASYLDDDHKQQLHGRLLELWVEPTSPNPQANDTRNAPLQATPAAGDRSRQRPHRLEAYQHVSAHSPDMNIADAERLTVWFEDKPERLPEDTLHPGSTNVAASPGPSNQGPGRLDQAPAKSGTEKPPPSRKPINLKARVVVAHVNRIGARNELKNMTAEGTVHVRQEASDDGSDKGVEITGETLELVQYPQEELRPSPGDRLVVLGNTQKPAFLQLGDLIMVGPKVIIDQKENSAEVQGIGYMNMPSNTSFEGGKPAQAGARLEVHWNTGMVFDGKEANFYGGFIATQDNGRMKGNTLQVTLDRAVSLKEGQARQNGIKADQKSQNARVEKMVCDGKDVFVEDTIVEKGKLVRYSRLVCQGLAMDNQPAGLDRQGAPNQPGSTLADGPGTVYLVQPGAVDNANGPAPTFDAQGRRQTQAGRQPTEEMKLTRVDFGSRMRTDSYGTWRRAIFYDRVEVINVPSDRADIQVDRDKLPERGMYLTSDRLTVYTTSPQAGGKATQVLIAEGKVTVRTPELLAHAQRVSYEEAKDLLIFVGDAQNQATFYKLSTRVGVEPPEFRGRKIFLWRSAKQFQVEDGGSIRNLN